MINRQFGHIKVRYRGLKKNTAQPNTLFALANLWMARKKLDVLDGKICLKTVIAGCSGRNWASEGPVRRYSFSEMKENRRNLSAAVAGVLDKHFSDLPQSSQFLCPALPSFLRAKSLKLRIFKRK